MRFEVSLMIFYLEDTLLLVKKEKISSCLDKKKYKLLWEIGFE